MCAVCAVKRRQTTVNTRDTTDVDDNADSKAIIFLSHTASAKRATDMNCANARTRKQRLAVYKLLCTHTEHIHSPNNNIHHHLTIARIGNSWLHDFLKTIINIPVSNMFYRMWPVGRQLIVCADTYWTT